MSGQALIWIILKIYVPGARVESLCRSLNNVDEPNIQSIIQASRNLLSSITKILLLADITLVRKLLLLEDVSNRTLKKFECVKNYMEFVRAFSQFGSEMIDLSNVTKSKLVKTKWLRCCLKYKTAVYSAQDYSKNERRSAQMFAAKQVLERSGNLLLTSSILSMKYPDCPLIKENKDTVFCQMRRAMDLIHYIVRDSVCDEKTSNIHLQDEVSMRLFDKKLQNLIYRSLKRRSWTRMTRIWRTKIFTPFWISLKYCWKIKIGVISVPKTFPVQDFAWPLL